MGSPITRAQPQSFLTEDSLHQDAEFDSVNRSQRSASRPIQRLLLAFSILTGTGLWLAIATPSQASEIRVAQSSSPPITQAEAATQYVFVSPTQGNDSGSGTQSAPLRSLTQALSRAQSGTTIVLSPGTYSEDTGEQFPLQLKPGVTVQGNRDQQGNGIVIRGGGSFLSPTAARQNIAVLAVSQSTLIGVTVTNPNPRGYGVWVESSSPTLVYNTFRDNIHDGVAVNGTSAPSIQHNLFLNNGTNGVSVFGRSSPRIQQNVFEQTGYGVYIGDEAQPTVISNRIVNNRSGVIVQEQARPVLRHNQIEGNQQNGVVAIAQALPDLGTPESPGHNQFSQNGEADINAEVAQYPVVAVGNQFAQQRLIGSVDLTGSMPLFTAQGATPLALESGTAALSTSSARSSEQTLSAPSSNLSSNPQPLDTVPVLEPAPALLAPQSLTLTRPTQADTAADRATNTPPVSTTSIVAASQRSSPPSAIASNGFPQPSRTPQASQTARRTGALAIEEFVTPSSSSSRPSPTVTQSPARITPPSRPEAAPSASTAPSPNLMRAVTPAAPSVPSEADAPTPSAYVERLLSQISATSTSRSASSQATRPSSDRNESIGNELGASQNNQSEDAVELQVIDPPATATASSMSVRTTPNPRPVSSSNAALLSLLPSRSTQQTAEPDPEGIPLRVVMPSEVTSQPQLTTIAAAQASPVDQAEAAPRPTIRPRNQNLLPVPTADVPYGHVGSRSRISVGNNPLANRIGPSANRIQMLGLRYRVLVEANGRDAETVVRSLVPGAFRTNLNGRSLMQAGAYSSLDNANDMARQLANRGLRTEVQQMQ